MTEYNGMPKVPADYESINEYNSMRSPSTVHVQDTGLARFYRKNLFQRFFSVYKWTFPETWITPDIGTQNYFQTILYGIGYIAIVNTDKFGVIPQQCGLMGYNVFYQPKQAIISNPLLTGILNPEIGTQCAIIKLRPDYSGILDIINQYGDMLALTMQACAGNLVNSKLSYVFASENKTAAESFKKLYDTIASGEPAAFYDKNLLNDDGSPAWQLFDQNVGNNFIADKCLNSMREIMNQFDSEIGIPNANVTKKERLITDEANANNTETRCLSDLWLESMQVGCRTARELFGISLDVEKRYKEEPAEQEGMTDAQ